MFFVKPLFAKDFVMTSPEKAGFSSERLNRVNEFAQRYINQNKYSNIVTLIARNGKVVHEQAIGAYGVDNPAPIDINSLYRIYSMTKPITAAAVMQLYEQGKFHIDDPVSKYLPEFKQQKLWADGKLIKPQKRITIRHLLTHTAGLTYGWIPEDPVDQQYQKAQLFSSKDLNEFIEKLAELPLKYEPGERYHYSVAFDVLGALIERVSNMSLDDYMQIHIFDPLGMRDTFFQVPKEKLHRLLSDQGWDYEQRKIVAIPAEQRRSFENVELLVGGGGLVSTARDYLRFCQMILNGGELNGARILGPKTVEMMSGNHLSDDVRANGVGEYPLLDLYSGQSMALGWGVVTNPTAMPDLSSLGELSWGGVAGTKFWIDPKEKLIGIALVQLYQSPWPLRADFKTAAYQALDVLY